MPDNRTHRGAHPEDAHLFAPSCWPALRRASGELWWLLDHGYALRSALELVGNRHELNQRQRVAVARSACSETQRQRRVGHEVAPSALRGGELWLDGYNLLISVEAALARGVILLGRDGCHRDMASLHGTYREVSETVPALRLIGTTLAGWRLERCRWFLDRPVSNSGRLRGIIADLAAEAGWPWDVHLEFNPDKLLAEAGDGIVVATSDSVVLDRCACWVNAGRHVIESSVPGALVIDLQHCNEL